MAWMCASWSNGLRESLLGIGMETDAVVKDGRAREVKRMVRRMVGFIVTILG